jgi:hypothetical protein
MPLQRASDEPGLSASRSTRPMDRGTADRGTASRMLAQNSPRTVVPSVTSANSPSPSPALTKQQTVSRETFRAKLVEGVQKALKARIGFGRAVGSKAFGPPRFDGDYFVVQNPQSDHAYLQLKTGKTPAEAVDAIFSSSDKWKFDCFEFAEVLQLYALRESLGPSATGTNQFNELVRGAFKRANDPKSGLLELRPRAESALPYREWFHVKTDKKDNPVNGPLITRSRDSRGQRVVRTITQEEGRRVDVGSLVTFTNPRATKPVWQNENAISLGEGQFVAWGITPYILTVDSIINHLASNSAESREKRVQSIFITGITVPDIPWR